MLNGKSLAEAAADLANRDRDLARTLKTHGVPPLWGRRPGFQTLVRIILEQQVSLASAQAAYRRLAAGVAPLTPERMLALGAAHVRGLGVTRQKAGYCLNLAEAIQEGGVDLRALARMDDAAARAALVRIKGIGNWTADIYLLMAMRRPDVWPSGDVALAKALQQLKGLRVLPSVERQTDMAQAWRPYRSVAARMLWQHYLKDRTAGGSSANKGLVG